MIERILVKVTEAQVFQAAETLGLNLSYRQAQEVLTDLEEHLTNEVEAYLERRLYDAPEPNSGVSENYAVRLMYHDDPRRWEDIPPTMFMEADPHGGVPIKRLRSHLNLLDLTAIVREIRFNRISSPQGIYFRP